MGVRKFLGLSGGSQSRQPLAPSAPPQPLPEAATQPPVSSASCSSTPAAPQPVKNLDRFHNLAQVQEELRQQGLESSNLIIAVDFTKSNEWTGKSSFHGHNLHEISPLQLNPYQRVIKISESTLKAFDDDGLYPVYGFGDVTTGSRRVFSFKPDNESCDGVQEVLTRYQQLAQGIKLSGPTSFAPAIYQAMKLVIDSGFQYHILLIIADGQVTQRGPNVDAIVAASRLPLSIIMVGVGDGPWEDMKSFDDELRGRKFDNFQFVNFTEVMEHTRGRPAQQREAQFALHALMEVPDQYKAIRDLNLIERNQDIPLPHWTPPLEPPIPMQDAEAQPSSVAAEGAGLLPPQDAHPQPATGAQGAGQAPLVRNNSQLMELMQCPITMEVMEDPVIAADGYTYERAVIEGWFKKSDISPMTNQRLPSKALIPNFALRSSIQEYQMQGS